jgi:hypothetical protein
LVGAACVCCAVVAPFARVEALPPLERSFSSSRQFIAYGGDSRLRGVVCDVAERGKRNLLHRLQQSDEWRTPIVINLQFREANVPEIPATKLNVSQTGFGLKIQLDLMVTSNIDERATERELLRATVTEMMYRTNPTIAAGLPYVAPPEWLISGLLFAAPELENDRPVDLLHRLAVAGRIMPLNDFLRQNPALLDSPSRAVFEAYSFGLIQLLLAQPDGASHLAQFIADLPHSPADSYADLKAHFPLFAGADDHVQETWTVALAGVATRGRFHSLTIAETEHELDRCLQIRMGNADPAKVYRLEDFETFMKLSGRAAALRGTSDQLQLLATHANPAYRPVVGEYQQIAAQLARGKKRRIAQRLARVGRYRATLAVQMRGIDDYMNWFEATQSQTTSGAFTEYFKAANGSGTSDRQRRDALSVYLDSVEAQFESSH